jgi:phage-related minor tail protein
LSGAGARALGGPVSSGVPYLVGERGPEMFVPATNGTIAATPAAQSPRPQIVLNVTTPDAQSFARSEPQLAALMARALARGQRNL